MRDKYLWLTLGITVLIAAFFFGDIFLAPDDYIFSSGGDGLQTYYQSIYHVKYDTTYWHQQGMNYPYGESIFFTGGQPFASNFVKAMMPVIDLSNHMVGITNLMMLMGIFVCSLFLFLLLRQFAVAPLYAMAVAIGLTFCTQQLDRMGGHYMLAYICAIPGMIYFLLRYYKTYSWKWSIVICLYLSFLVFAQLYYFVFCGVIALGFWLAFIAFNKERQITIWRSLLHGAVQLVLPFIILQVFISISSDVTDRTAIPWGFMVYRSSWGGYLFPYSMWYEHWFDAFKPVAVEWEGLAYVGGAAIIIFILVVLNSVFRFRSFLLANASWDKRAFIALTTSAVICIAASFAFPFNYGFENLLMKLGVLQQFRGIGRFAFVAFYLINVLLFVLFWRIPFRQQWLKYGCSFLLIALLFSDAYTRTSGVAHRIKNERGDLLTSIPNDITSRIEVSRYQAILPFPFFHIGSENIGADCDISMKNFIYDLSIKTGLPTFAASMSRTSLGQSFRELSLSQEVMQMPQILYDLPASTQILLVCDTSQSNHLTRQLLSVSDSLFSYHKYVFYELSMISYGRIREQNLKLAEESRAFTYPLGEHLFTNDSGDVIFYEEEPKSHQFTSNMFRNSEIQIPPSWRGDTIACSFWVKDFQRDLLPRTTLEIVQKNNETVTNYFVEYIGKRFIGLHGNDALIECLIPVEPGSGTLSISFENKLIQNEWITIESLLIRPKDSNFLILRNHRKSLNNRI